MTKGFDHSSRMRLQKTQLFLSIVGLFLFSGCFHQAQNSTEQKENILPARVIAILPVESNNHHGNAHDLLRKKLYDELRFRGYAPIALNILDEKLQAFKTQSLETISDKRDISSLQNIMEFDAVMSCTLLQDSHNKSFLYAPIVVEARCELRRKTTNELVWNAQAKAQSRNFDLTAKRIERKIYEDYENVVTEVVEKLFEKLPDGPDLR